MGQEVSGEGEVEVKEEPGGKCAVMVHRGYPNPEAWRRLWDWARSSGYKWRKTHELARICSPMAAEGDVRCELYLPIEG